MSNDMTTEELAKLAKCGVTTVKRACESNEIPGARRDIVGNSVAWLIPREAGETWAEQRIPYATQKTHQRTRRADGRFTANIDARTLPAPGSVPVTRDNRPPDSTEEGS